MGLLLLLSVFTGVLTLSVTAATPASATTLTQCIDPASGGTSQTFVEGTAATYSVECEGESGVSGTTAYPSAITISSGSLPASGDLTLATACTDSTSGSGATEQYILTCKITGTPSSSDTGSYPLQFTPTPSPNGGAATTSGTLTLNVVVPTVTCIDPAAAGTASTFYEGSASSYTVECESQSDISSVTAYPSSIHIASGALPADGNPTFATSTSSSPACTTGTSGSGATEEYILECALADTPTTADAGSYPITFTATGVGGNGSGTSGTLTVNVSPPTTTCSTPAAAGTTAPWVDGTAETETITCYSQGFSAANAGNYPSSITVNSGSLPAGSAEATSLTSSPACTTATSGSGTAEEYELECKVTDTPTSASNGTYHVTFLATGGTNGAPSITSGTLTINITQPAPSWATSGSTDGNYFSAIKGVPFCDDIEVSAGQVGPSGTNPGSTASLPLTSITAGTTPANVTNYSIQDVNLATGSAQICGTNNNNVASSPATMAPVATNTGGSATDSIPLWSQNKCTWSTTGTSTSDSLFDGNQDLYQAGSQSAFGQPITNGEVLGSSDNQPNCAGGVGVSAAGGLGTAWTINTANPLPTPTDSNPSAADGDLPSSNLDLTSANTGSKGGCWGAVNIFASTSTTTFVSSSAMTMPSSWVNGGDCTYGGLGSNSAGGNTDTTALNGPTGDASCPPTQADVNAGLVSCSITASSGNDENGSTNYSTMQLFFNGQPVPQTPTASLSQAAAQPGDTVTVNGGTNWWGANDGAPNSGPYGDFQNDSSDFYPVSAPSVYIGTSRATAVPVVDSTVTINQDSYACTGAESTTVGPNPCALTVGQPTGTFQVPAGLAPGSYNVYIDESNTTPLPGNGPSDAYQTARGTSLGTVQSTSQLDVEGVMVLKTSTTNYTDGGYSKAGDQIDYNSALTNQGPDTLSNVTVNDNKIPTADIVCPDGSTLAGNTSENCTGVYTVTQADVDNGSVSNTAYVTATSISGESLTSASSSVTVLASDATSTLSITKTATTGYSDGGYKEAGDVINYQYVVTNTGTTTLSNVGVSDNEVTVSCPAPTLAPGASETCTATYTVTQADVDAGSVTNTATASAANPQAVGVSSNTTSLTVDASDAISSLNLVKSTSSTGYAAAGDTIGYSYQVTNNGTTDLASVGVSDSLISDVSCPQSTLAPGASETCTGSYTVTQADVDNGSVTNTATADATSPPFSTPVTSPEASVTVAASGATSGLSLTKSTTSTGYAAAGDTISYSYQVTNTGTTDLTNVGVNDNLISSVSCPDSTLVAGNSETCSGTYTVTQGDVDSGSVTNTATAEGTSPSNRSIESGSSSVTVLASGATSSLSLSKSTNSNGYAAAGNTINYSYLVTNTGTTTLSGVGVSDNLIPTVVCPDASLAPAASETCTGSYTVTQADVDNGSVTNTATASATAPDGGGSVSSGASSVTVDASQATSSIGVLKSTTSTGYAAAGNTIPYSYLVSNTGTTDLSSVSVTDSLIPSVSCPDSSLAPATSETCTATYTVTQADVDNGSVTNSATAQAKAPPSGTAIISGQSSVTVDASGATSTLSLTKSTTSTGYGKAGQTISYSYLVTNTGTESLTGVGVTDNKVSVSCPHSSLAPGASETCTATYTVTQADVDAGSVTNVATANGTNPHSVAVGSPSATVTVEANSATSKLSVTETSTATSFHAAGNVLHYSFKVTNTGTTTLSAVHVTDTKATSLSCPSAPLAPAASETCTGSYTVTQPDVHAGSVVNTVTARATNPHGVAEASATASKTIDVTGLRVTNASLAGATRNVSYSAQLNAAGGSSPFTWYLVSGSMPPYLRLSSSGLISGKPETAGSYTITVGVKDSNSPAGSATATFTITVAA